MVNFVFKLTRSSQTHWSMLIFFNTFWNIVLWTNSNHCGFSCVFFWYWKWKSWFQCATQRSRLFFAIKKSNIINIVVDKKYFLIKHFTDFDHSECILYLKTSPGNSLQAMSAIFLSDSFRHQKSIRKFLCVCVCLTKSRRPSLFSPSVWVSVSVKSNTVWSWTVAWLPRDS